jgi:tight adherence protein B
MQGAFLPIIVCAAVMLLVYAIIQVVLGLTDSEKRKLKERLAGEGSGEEMSEVQKRITIQQDTSAFAGTLTQISFFDGVNRMLVQAYPEMTLSRFLTIATGVGVGVFLIAMLVTQSVIVSGVAGAIGIYAPCIWLSHKRSKRQRLLADQLPEALDFLSRILKAGHSLSTGLQMMADELPQPLAGEFRKAYDGHSLGQSMEECLKDMTRRIESTDFAFFVTAVLIQRQTGGDLSEVLNNISDMIRQRIRLQQHVKAKTAGGRFTGYILSAFPAVMFVIAYTLNPDYAGVLIRTTEGMVLLGIALGLQMMGLYCIKKITTVVV